MIKGFRDFILRGNVVDLAIAVVIGAAFGTVVQAFTQSLLMPLIALIGGKPNFNSLRFDISTTTFPYGVFLTALVSFLIVAAVIYFFVVAPMNTIQARLKTEAPVDKPTRDCPECLSSIPAVARRCAFCTAEVGTAPAT